jgi:AhpD family alkylhydroperoxidase
MAGYQSPDDLALVPRLAGLAPPEAQAFLAFNALIARDDGAIPRKYRELIALAVAMTTQCAYCLDVHAKHAKAAGASAAEVAEAAFIAAALRAGAALGHGLLALRLHEEGA